MVTLEAANTHDALELAVEQDAAEQLDENTRKFIDGLENQFNVKFAEEGVAEAMAAKPEEDEGDEDEEDDDESDEEEDDEEGEDEYHDEGSDSGEDYE